MKEINPSNKPTLCSFPLPPIAKCNQLPNQNLPHQLWDWHLHLQSLLTFLVMPPQQHRVHNLGPPSSETTAYHSVPFPPVSTRGKLLRRGGPYLAPHIPGGLRWSPGAFFLAGSTAKLACMIHLDFTRTPGGLQMNHMESVESTCQIAVWILPGLNPGSIDQESRRSLFSLEFILLYF